MVILGLFLVTLYLSSFSFNSVFWIEWLQLNILVVLCHVCLLFSCVKLYFSRNMFELLLWAFLFIFSFVIILFLYQLDVFACFLLVSETVVIFFILTFLIYSNHTNSSIYRTSSAVIISFILVAGGFWVSKFDSNVYAYYIDWYVGQISSYNDLLSQYIYIYNLNNYLTLIIGLWLLLLTFFLVIILSTKSEVGTNGFINYFFKRQNMWKQWATQPFLKFFK